MNEETISKEDVEELKQQIAELKEEVRQMKRQLRSLPEDIERERRRPRLIWNVG